MSVMDWHSFGTIKSFTFNLKRMENLWCGLQGGMSLLSFRDPRNAKSLDPKHAAEIAPPHGCYGKQQLDHVLEIIESH